MVVRNDKLNIMKMDGIKFIRYFYKEIEGLRDENIYEFRGLSYQPGAPQFSLDMYQGILWGIPLYLMRYRSHIIWI